MTVQQLLDGARESLQGTKVDTDHFFKKLAEFFGYEDPKDLTVDDLSSATWEDLEECGLPKGKAKTIANKVFRDGENKSGDEPQRIVLDVSNDPEKHAASLDAVQLVDYYNPENHTNPYGKKLKSDTEGRRCLAFNKDGSLNKEISRGLVDEIVNLQYPEREEVTIDGIPSPTFRVGERPDRFASENPADPGSPLRPDGISDAGCEWEKVPLNIRQLVYIAVQSTKEADKDEIDIFDRVNGKSFEQVAARYRKAAVEFGEREKLGTLPQLKIRLSGRNVRPQGGDRQDPFARGHRVW